MRKSWIYSGWSPTRGQKLLFRNKSGEGVKMAQWVRVFAMETLGPEFKSVAPTKIRIPGAAS